MRIELRNSNRLRCRHSPNSGRQYLGVRYARTFGVAGVKDQGMFSKGSSANAGELTVSSVENGFEVRPNRKEPGLSGTECVARSKRRKHSTEVSARQGQPEASVKGSRAVLRIHSTCEGGEPQGSREGRPRYPLEGREEQMDVSTW